MSTLAKTIILCVIIAGVFTVAGWNLKKYFTKDNSNETIFVHDTTTLIRYQIEEKHDTTVRFVDRIIYREVKPIVIYKQKIDSIFLESIRYKDLMLKVNKVKRTLYVYAVNEKDSVIKEYVFENIGPDFDAVSQENNIYVKTKRFYWEGLTAGVEFSNRTLSINKENMNYFPFLETGMNYDDFMHINAGFKYDYNNKEFGVFSKIGLKFIK